MFQSLLSLSAAEAFIGAVILLSGYFVFYLAKVIHRLHFHPLRTVPGPWLPAASSLWIRYQRWHGQLSFTADALLKKYGPIVRISPSLVLVNDPETVHAIFTRQDLDTAPKAIRALRIGGHDWTVTIPQNGTARDRRRPVMLGTTTNSLKYWRPFFEEYVAAMVRGLASSEGTMPEDIVHHLRVATLQNSAVVMAGSHARIEPRNFPHIVGEYNFLVVWRLCLPEWLFSWLRYGPSAHSRFRVQSSERLFGLGEEICRQARRWEDVDPADRDDIPSVYKLLTERGEKGGSGQPGWSEAAIGAEMAGQILAATETTSSALAFIFYELAKNPALVEELHAELQSQDGASGDGLDSLKLLDACIKEGLRFRPPVAFTASRLVPAGGLDVLGHFVPEGTVLTTQSLSFSRQRPDLFPDCDIFDPSRWLMDDDFAMERRRLLVPFGVGARRCPGNNMALYQMRMILAAVVRSFRLGVAPQTTPEAMAPFEANGFRSRFDECYLMFIPRG